MSIKDIAKEFATSVVKNPEVAGKRALFGLATGGIGAGAASSATYSPDSPLKYSDQFGVATKRPLSPEEKDSKSKRRNRHSAIGGLISSAVLPLLIQRKVKAKNIADASNLTGNVQKVRKALNKKSLEIEDFLHNNPFADTPEMNRNLRIAREKGKEVDKSRGIEKENIHEEILNRLKTRREKSLLGGGGSSTEEWLKEVFGDKHGIDLKRLKDSLPEYLKRKVKDEGRI